MTPRLLDSIVIDKESETLTKDTTEPSLHKCPPVNTTRTPTLDPPDIPTALSTHTPPTIAPPSVPVRPFLGLHAKLSLAFASPMVIYLLFSAWHLYRARDTVQTIIMSTKTSLTESCQDLERAISILSAFPDIAADATRQALVVGIDTVIHQTSYGLQVILQGVLETIEFIVTFLTGTWRCFLVHLATSGLPVLSEIGDGGVQAIDELTVSLMVLLSGPLNALAMIIQEEMLMTEQIKKAILGTGTSLQQQNNRTEIKAGFCVAAVGEDTLSSVNVLIEDFQRWILYGALIMVGGAVLVIALNMALTAYYHRRWKIYLGHISGVLYSVVDTPVHGQAEHVLIMSGSQPEETIKVTATQLVQHARHPMVFHFANTFAWWMFPKDKTKRDLFLWCMDYISHPPAVTCLTIGLLGLILVYGQLAFLAYTRTHYRPQEMSLQPVITHLSLIAQSQIQQAMTSASFKFSNETNAIVTAFETDLNERVFGAVAASAKEMSSALAQVQRSLVEGVYEVFGGLFGELVLAVLRCLLLNKLDKVQAGLFWVQNHAQMTLPRLAPEVLIISVGRMDQVVNIAMGNEAVTSRAGMEMGLWVGQVLDRYEEGLRRELSVYYSLVMVWVIVFLAGAPSFNVTRNGSFSRTDIK
ncbi:plasma membrane fusion protein prm1 [Podila epigama]|nr:plasma membrane fusion protein prm1 [Podila epigama]